MVSTHLLEIFQTFILTFSDKTSHFGHHELPMFGSENTNYCYKGKFYLQGFSFGVL